MLHFILGRNYCDKTGYVRQLVADRVNAGQTGFILLVPEQFSFDTEKGMLEKVGAAGMQGLEVLSFTRLAELVLEKAGKKSKKQTVDKGVKILTMSLAIDSLSDRLEIFGKYASRPQLTQSIVSLATELKQCSVPVDRLAEFAQDAEESSLKNKLNELSMIISAYNAMLEQSYYDTDDALTLLGEALIDYKFFEGKTVVIDEFKSFTKQETEVIERILTQAEDVYITFNTDPKMDSGEMPQFENINLQISKLRRVAEGHSAKIADTIIVKAENGLINGDLLRLEENMFKPEKDVRDEYTPDSITVYSADNKADECNFIALMIKKLMREKNVRCRDIVVYQREKGSYDSELVSAFRRYGVPFFEDRRQPVEAQPLTVFVSSLLDLVCNSVTTQSLMRYLRTGLSPLTDDEVNELENYTFMWNIKTSEWKKDFTENPRGLGQNFEQYDTDLLARLNEYRKKAMDPILEFESEFSAAQGENKAAVLFDFLKKNDTVRRLRERSAAFADGDNTDLFEEQDAVWSLMMQILDRLYIATKQTSVSDKRFYELYNMLVSVSDLGTLPQGLDDVTLAVADRSRTGLKKYVFIVGANDGVFPKTPSTEGLLNDRDRNDLKKAGIELAETARYKGIEEEYFAYNAVCSATEGLFVAYSLSDYSGNALAESETVSMIKSVFPKVKVLDSESFKPIDRIESGASAFDEYARAFNSDTVLKHSLGEYFKNDEVYSGRINTLKNAAEKREKKLTDSETAEKLFGKNIKLSASRIDCFIECPFKYFCKYGLKAGARKEAKIDSMLRGTIMHYVFESLLSKFTKQQLEVIDDGVLEKEINSVLEEYLEKFMGGADSKTKRFLVSYRMIGKDLLVLFRRLCEEFKTCSFEPKYFELGIGGREDSDIAPYKLTLDDGSTIEINGKVDRVDVMNADGRRYVRIIDYKSRSKDFSLGEVLNGFNMQMLIYLFALYENGKEKLGDFVPSGILYMPAKTAAANLGRDATEEQIKQKKLYENKMTGIVLDDMTVLEGMEKDLNGYFIPVSMKDGKPVGSLISLKALMNLKNELEKTIRGIAEKLHEGVIRAEPTKDACQYCDYKMVCGFEEGDSPMELPLISDEEAIRMLESEGEGEDNG